jgi:hypothetical protein
MFVSFIVSLPSLSQFSCNAFPPCPGEPMNHDDTADNSLVCFACDYNLCRACAERAASRPQASTDVHAIRMPPILPEEESPPPSYAAAIAMV